MSKIKVKYEIYKELKKVNNEIDRRIIRGTSYKYEALRHKFLLSQLRRLTGKKWLPQSANFLSFLF